MLRKRRTSVIGSSDLVGSRFCCTWTWKCCRKSEVADLWTGLLCWSLGTAREAYERFRWHRERGRTYMHRSRSGTPPARTNERVITRHISIERMDSGACVRKEEALEKQLPYLAHMHHMPTKFSWQRLFSLHLAYLWVRN